MGHFLNGSNRGDGTSGRRRSSHTRTLHRTGPHPHVRSPSRDLGTESRETAAAASSPTTTTSAKPHEYYPPHHLTAEAVASLPPPGVAGPTGLAFSPSTMTHHSHNEDSDDDEPLYLAFVSSLPSPVAAVGRSRSDTGETVATSSKKSREGAYKRRSNSTAPSHGERQLCFVDCTSLITTNSKTTRQTPTIHPLLQSMPPKQPPVAAAVGTNPIQTSYTTTTATAPATTTTTSSPQQDSLEERLRRERQRLHSSGASVTQFEWTRYHQTDEDEQDDSTSGPRPLRVLVPLRGNLYAQHSVCKTPKDAVSPSPPLQCLYDKTLYSGGGCGGAIDPQLSPDGTMVAFVLSGDIHVVPIRQQHEDSQLPDRPIPITYGAQPQQYGPPPPHSSSNGTCTTNASMVQDAQPQSLCVTHGLADFLAQEEMDRYRGYWWSPTSDGILFTRVDETRVPAYRITHQGRDTVANTTTTSSAQAPYTSSMQGEIMSYEDHRYPFAGQGNPHVQLGYVPIDRASMLFAGGGACSGRMQIDSDEEENELAQAAQHAAQDMWDNHVMWLQPPREATEYLARADWLPDGSVWAQWQSRSQSTLVLCRMDINTGKTRTLLTERTETWINLHHMMYVLPNVVHPADCDLDAATSNCLPAALAESPLPEESFSFLFASERSGFSHLYLYTYVPGINGDRAMMLRTVSDGEWMVESIAGVDMEKDVVYVTGTYDSPLERHLYALPLCHTCRALDPPCPADGPQNETIDVAMDSPTNGTNGRGVRRGLKSVMNALSGASKPRLRNSHSSNMSFSEASDTTVAPLRLTTHTGMHTVCMDDGCRLFVDSSSDLGRPTQVRVYRIPDDGPFARRQGSDLSDEIIPAELLFTVYDASGDDSSALVRPVDAPERLRSLSPPELLSYPTSDGTETLHAALYRPDPRAHGPGPYPLVCAVYGGPHVQRVNRSWAQCADMRAQRLCSLGFAVVKCDNRGSSRRGVKFESAVHRRLGRLEVLDQVTTVRQLTMRGVADSSRVGVYGWSYGGYLSAMCLCRAPDVFHAAVAGAPVTSWDGYDTHYTERYMGLPSDNGTGYRESAVLEHVPNLRGHLLLVHGLIDENVHFRHTARLINRLIAAGKDYDLLIFPDERHSPRRLRDRLYMEQRISDFFLRHLGLPQSLQNAQPTTAMSSAIAGQTGGGGHRTSSNGGGDGGGGSRSSVGSGGNLRTMAGHL